MSSALFALAADLAVGERVRVSGRDGVGHCRTPFYLRGKIGRITSVFGAVRDPVLLAYHKPGLPPRVLYRVRFRQIDLWPDYAGSSVDTLDADLYDLWLERVPHA